MRRTMRVRGVLDIILLLVAVVLLVVVGYGILNPGQINLFAGAVNKDTTNAVSSDETINAEAGVAAAGGSGAVDANFGWSGEGAPPVAAMTGDLPAESNTDSEDAAAGDEAATLEEIARPAEIAPAWDLDGTFAAVMSGNGMYVNVRVGPGLGYGVMRSVPPRTQVQIVRRSVDEDWIRITLEDGNEGWIFGDLLLLE